MNYQHKNLASGNWHKLSFFEQMANIGSEIARTIKWRKKKGFEIAENAFIRALELLDLTISDKKNLLRLKELMRLREVMVDYFKYDNIYNSSDSSWQKYFYAFNYAVRKNT